MPQTTRRAALALAGLAPAWPARAFPDRPVTLVVAAPPGGANDFAARTLAVPLGAALGQPVVVESRAGGNGALAQQAVARARPDGHAVLFSYSGFISALPALSDPPALDATIEPVAMVMEAPHLVVVAPGVAAADLAGLLALARARPGALNYGTPGIGSVPHLATELLAARAGIRLEHVPYRGSGPLVQDLLAGRIELTVATPVSVLGHVRAGRLRALAVAGPNRIAALPDVPTAAEAGLPGLDADAWFGCHVARGTPGAVAARLAEAVEACVAAEAFRRAVAEQGAVPRFLPGPALQARAERELREWTELARANSIRLP